MTDLEKTKAFLDDLQIGYKFNDNDEYYNNYYGQKVMLIRLEAKEDKKVDGYGGYICQYVFDKAGKLITLDIFD